MRCSIQGCLGEYEMRKISHTLRRRGLLLVVDHVPAEVCNVCGDVLLAPAAVRHIEELLSAETAPAGSVPLYEYT